MVQSFVHYTNATFVFVKTSYRQAHGHLNFMHICLLERHWLKADENWVYIANSTLFLAKFLIGKSFDT